MPRHEEILAGLNPAQREAAESVRGPVAILAGAGTGKTTTITRRIAFQVATGAFSPTQLLAVTFTEKAAGELQQRLSALGVHRVEARTFHSAALRQLAELWEPHTGDPLPDVLDTKAPIVASLANGLPAPYRFLPRRELSGEIEWAKNRMIPVDRYASELANQQHESPIPADLMERVYRAYERRKAAMRRLDFEDMLGLAVQLFDRHPAAVETVRRRYRAFTVDEYQDVNPLQQAILDRWLGDRDELCVVGDDYQTIYAFTGASPSYLLSFPERFPDARVVRLEESYRSTREILDLANKLSSRMGGFRKKLRAAPAARGPQPLARAALDAAAEIDLVVGQVQRLRGDGVPLEHMAILYRINARSEPFEEALADAGIPYQVRDGAFLRRPGPRSTLQMLRKEDAEGEPVELVEQITAAIGYDPEGEPSSDDEATRQMDLARMRALAEEFAGAHPGWGAGAFIDELRNRFSTERTARGVNLLTYHRAKGLEYDAVFLPRLIDAELPFRTGRSKASPEEERRLLYVGITRAKRHLLLSWPLDARGGPSPFLREIGIRAAPKQRAAAKRAVSDSPLLDSLREWRRRRAIADGVPAYVIFHDSTLGEIAERRPGSRIELARVTGVGPTKLDRYGDDVIDLVRESSSGGA